MGRDAALCSLFSSYLDCRLWLWNVLWRAELCILPDNVVVSRVTLRAGVFRCELGKVGMTCEHISANARREVDDDMACEKECVGCTYCAPLA